ncbi:MAG: hypothetical protein E6I44_12685 [Chloroflexi bacterium]|nr:MAG: hypothetical protein E6I44_12685 [Chloroflexota bacterium]
MLTCYMCGQTKPEAEFAFDNIAKGTRQRHCRKCQAAYRRAHYLANRHDYIKREVARMNRYRIENRVLMLAYLVAHPCVDCGQTEPVMLDFDHREPAKKNGNVSELAMRKPWRLVLVEIAKCDVRCANCHLRRTARQFTWKKVAGRPLTEGAWLERVIPSDEAETSRGGIASETKKCTGCGLERPVAEFPIKNKQTGRRGTLCRACRSAYGRRHYEQNREKYTSRVRARRDVRDTYWSWLMTYLAWHPCVDCGETDPVVLEFDHREGTTKVGNVGAMLSRASWSTLLSEIAKCDVRCANCHRLRTAQQFSWSKWIRESA